MRSEDMIALALLSHERRLEQARAQRATQEAHRLALPPSGPARPGRLAALLRWRPLRAAPEPVEACAPTTTAA